MISRLNEDVCIRMEPPKNIGFCWTVASIAAAVPPSVAHSVIVAWAITKKTAPAIMHYMSSKKAVRNPLDRLRQESYAIDSGDTSSMASPCTSLSDLQRLSSGSA